MKSAKMTCILLCLLGFAGAAAANPIYIDDEIQTYSSLSDTTVYMTGTSELHLTASSSPMTGCVIHLNSPDAWLFLSSIQPSSVNTSAYRNQIRVNGAAAVVGTNIRIVQHLQGTVVIPHGSNYTPLQVYSGFNYTGVSQSLGSYTYYRTSQLGALNNNISSFRLKRGYSATFAEHQSGAGVSRVYVAQDRDINIPILPEELNNKASFVRVIPWRWVTQKGWSGTGSGGATQSAMTLSTWRYDWDNETTSTLNIEYIPMRHNSGWNAYSNINNKQNSTHALGFNEPDKSDQANMTVAQAIDAWPNLLASGLRLGSPAPSDASAGLDWLYAFMDEADARNYRVDYVAVHYYKKNWTGTQMYNWLRGIHERTRRPVWITEWNNGCNWTDDVGSPPPTYEYNATKINELITWMATAPFVERYSIYQWCTNREMILGSELTPAGIVYHDHVAPMAYIQEPDKGGYGCAYYAFEGNLQDGLAYGNHAASIGGHSFAAGRGGGQALSLSGANQYVRLPDNLANGDDFTFAAWVYWGGGNTWQRIFDFGDGTSRYMMLTPRSGDNTLRFDITASGSGGVQRLQTSQLAANQWVHVAVTMSGNTGRLFVNGSPVATNNSMTLRASDVKKTQNFLGRSQYAGDTQFNGRLDDVYIANYALSNAQVAALHGGTLGNVAPKFTRNPVVRPSGLAGTAYNDALIYDAGDFDENDSLTFSTISGPEWLNVAADGTLSGTPGFNHVGVNSFTVRVTDSAGAFDEATLNITVDGLGLRAHYAFDGNANDSAGTRHGTAVGSPGYALGKFDQAINLDGVDDHVVLPANVIDTSNFTVATWVLWGGGDQWQRIFDFGDGTTQYMFLTPCSGSDTLRFAITGLNVSDQTMQTSQLATEQWVHVAVTLDGTTGRLYVNGSPAATNNSMTLNPGHFDLVRNFIGRSQFAADPYFAGRVDDFRIYNYALNADAVMGLYLTTMEGPFGGQPHPIPGRVEAEQFDHGGQNIAYYDTTPGNSGGQYRLDVDVDIRAINDFGADYAVTYIEAGEWLEYTVNVAETADYCLYFRASATADNIPVTVKLDGDTIATVMVNNTGSANAFRTFVVNNVALEAGDERMLRLEFTASGLDVNWIQFEKEGPWSGEPHTIPGKLEVELFDFGGPGVAYYDTTVVNAGGQFRTYESVDIYGITDGAAGYAIGNTETGEWVAYTVNSAVSSTDIYARVASEQAGGQIRVWLDDDLLATIDVPNTGSLTSWDTVSAPCLPLPDRENAKLKLEFVGTGFRLNWIEFGGQEPFWGVPSAVPGRLEFEDFDIGGQFISYYDKSPTNGYGQYRLDEAVDIQMIFDGGLGFAVYAEATEWLEYTCDIEAGYYTITVRSASPRTGGQELAMSVDGQTLATFMLPNTGGWGTWQSTAVSGVYLPGGEQVLRFAMQTSDCNLNYVDFIRETNPADITQSGRVDMDDFAVLAAQWLGTSGVPSADIAPAGGDGQVNLLDLLLLAENWLLE